MRVFLFFIILTSCTTDQSIPPTRHHKPVAGATASPSLNNSGGSLTVSPAATVIHAQKGGVWVSYQGAADLYRLANAQKDPCHKRNLMASIPRGGRLTIRAAFPKITAGAGSLAKGRLRVKVRMEGREIGHAVSTGITRVWNKEHPLLKSMEQTSFSLDLKTEVRSDLTVLVIDKQTDAVSVFTLSGVDALMESNSAILPKLRDSLGCTPPQVREKLAYKSDGAIVSPLFLEKDGLYAGVTAYSGIFTAVARMKKFLAKVESADSVHTLPAAQPDWHTVELAMTRGLLGRCRVSLYNVMANFISVAEKTPSTPLPGATEGTAGVDRAIVHIQKNVGTPLVIDVRCKNLSGQLTITPKIPIERVQPFIAPLKLQLQKALDNCASQRKKLGTKKLLLDRRLPQAQFLWEKHRILTKMLLDLIILENQLKRQSGGEVSLTTVKKEFMLVAIAHSYHARALYFMVRSDFYRQYGRYRPAALKNANMEAYRLSKDPRMQAYYRRYKKQFERLQAANRSYMAARHSVEELGKVQMYYKRFNTFSEPLLSPKDAPGQTTKSF